MTIGVNQRSLSHAAVLPEQLAIVEAHGGENRAGKTVQRVTYQDRTAMVILHVAVEIDLLGRHAGPVRLQFQKGATRTIVGGQKYAVVPNDWCGNVGGTVCHA